VIRGILYRKVVKKILEWLRERMAPVEIYRKIESPADTLEVPLDIKKENAELQAKLTKAQKRIQELEEEIKYLKGEKDKEKMREIKEQAEVLKKIKEGGKFDWFLIPEKPLRVTSIWNHKEFIDQYGDEVPYFAGFRFIQTEDGVFVKTLLTKNIPRICKLVPLFFREVSVIGGEDGGVPLNYFPMIFADSVDLVSWMKESRLRLNFNEEGKWIPPVLFAEMAKRKGENERGKRR
jgi:hypothetical protein